MPKAAGGSTAKLAKLHAKLRAAIEAIDREAAQKKAANVAEAHWAAAQLMVDEWLGGKTELALASGRCKLPLPAVQKKDHELVRALVKATKVTHYSVAWKIGEDTTNLLTTCKLSVAKWKATATWRYDELSIRGQHAKSELELTDFERGDELDFSKIFAAIGSALPKSVVGAYVWLVAFDLIDANLVPYARPFKDDLSYNGRRWEELD